MNDRRNHLLPVFFRDLYDKAEVNDAYFALCLVVHDQNVAGMGIIMEKANFKNLA